MRRGAAPRRGAPRRPGAARPARRPRRRRRDRRRGVDRGAADTAQPAGHARRDRVAARGRGPGGRRRHSGAHDVGRTGRGHSGRAGGRPGGRAARRRDPRGPDDPAVHLRDHVPAPRLRAHPRRLRRAGGEPRRAAAPDCRRPILDAASAAPLRRDRRAHGLAGRGVHPRPRRDVHARRRLAPARRGAGHRRVPRVRHHLAAGAGAPRLRPRGRPGTAHRDQRRAGRADGGHAGAAAGGRADLLPGRDGGRRFLLRRLGGRPARGPRGDERRAAHRDGGSRPGPAQRPGVRAGRGRGVPPPRGVADGVLPQRPGDDGRADRRGGLVPHRRPRAPRRGRPVHLRQPAQGHAQGGRGERRRRGGRGAAGGAPRGRGGGGRRGAGRPARRGRRGVRRARPGAPRRGIPGRSPRNSSRTVSRRWRPYKAPRYVEFVDSWPMSGTKIEKGELRDRVAADLAARGVTEAPRVSRPIPRAAG